MKIGGIYKITNKKNGKFYVGSSNNLDKRWKQHLYELLHKKHYNPYLQKTWNKYGKNIFNFEILEYIKNNKKLLLIEQKYINKLSPVYNLCPTAGSRLGMVTPLKTRKKLRLANLGKPHDRERKNAISKGKLRFYREHPEAVELARIKSTGFKKSLKTKRKHSEAIKLWLTNPKNYKNRIKQLNKARKMRFKSGK